MVSSATLKDADTTFSALAAGAFDYVPKQLSPTSLNLFDIRACLLYTSGTAHAPGVALVHRSGLRSGDPASLHVLEKPAWAVSGMDCRQCRRILSSTVRSEPLGKFFTLPDSSTAYQHADSFRHDAFRRVLNMKPLQFYYLSLIHI